MSLNETNWFWNFWTKWLSAEINNQLFNFQSRYQYHLSKNSVHMVNYIISKNKMNLFLETSRFGRLIPRFKIILSTILDLYWVTDELYCSYDMSHIFLYLLNESSCLTFWLQLIEWKQFIIILCFCWESFL